MFCSCRPWNFQLVYRVFLPSLLKPIREGSVRSQQSAVRDLPRASGIAPDHSESEAGGIIALIKAAEVLDGGQRDADLLERLYQLGRLSVHMSTSRSCLSPSARTVGAALS